MAAHEEVWLFTDGAARGNPGPAAVGFLITDAGDRDLAEHAECIGPATNNRAEYEALVRGLAACARFTGGRVCCVSDSTLLVGQMRGDYRVKSGALRPLHEAARDRERAFVQVTYTHRPRAEPHIARVDRLVNRALDRCATAGT
jgi:ribonuclease HI